MQNFADLLILLTHAPTLVQPWKAGLHDAEEPRDRERGRGGAVRRALRREQRADGVERPREERVGGPRNLARRKHQKELSILLTVFQHRVRFQLNTFSQHYLEEGGERRNYLEHNGLDPSPIFL